MKKTATVTVTFDLSKARTQYIWECADELKGLSNEERASHLEEFEIEIFECARDAWDNAEGGSEVTFEYDFGDGGLQPVTVPVQYSHCRSDHDYDSTFDCRWDEDDQSTLEFALDI